MATGSERSSHPPDGTVHALVLPDAQRQPTQLCGVSVGVLVAADIGFEFFAPPLGVVLRSVQVTSARRRGNPGMERFTR